METETFYLVKGVELFEIDGAFSEKVKETALVKAEDSFDAIIKVHELMASKFFSSRLATEAELEDLSIFLVGHEDLNGI
jgi:hypothetical protein